MVTKNHTKNSNRNPPIRRFTKGKFRFTPSIRRGAKGVLSPIDCICAIVLAQHFITTIMLFMLIELTFPMHINLVGDGAVQCCYGLQP
jgi:hypothetical protein